MPLITNVAYAPDPTDGQDLGLDVALNGATRLVVNWGDGSPLQLYQVEPGSSSIHVFPGASGIVLPARSTSVIAPPRPDRFQRPVTTLPSRST